MHWERNRPEIRPLFPKRSRVVPDKRKKRLQKELLLLCGMGNHASAKALYPENIASGGFGATGWESTWVIDAQAIETQWDVLGFRAETVSDVFHGPNVYTYVNQNPWTSFDPEGLALETIWDVANVAYDVSRGVLNLGDAIGGAVSYAYGAATGNQHLKQAAGEGLRETGGKLIEVAVDLGTDALASAIPFVPAGASKAIRAADKTADAAKAADKVVDGVKAADKIADTAKAADKTADATKTATESAENVAEAGKSGGKNFDQARREGFEKAGMTDPGDVKFTKVDSKTGTVVEFKGKDGAKVAYDAPHPSPGPHHDSPHVGWQTGGKRSSGGTERGNIPYQKPQHPSRPSMKGEGDVKPH